MISIQTDQLQTDNFAVATVNLQSDILDAETVDLRGSLTFPVAGRTPVKGVDYFTPDEINSIKGEIEEELSIPTKTSELENDSNFLTQHQDISGKVDKETGKGLSSNDYTDTEKTKLGGIEEGAQKNVTPTWDSVEGKPETFTPSEHTHDYSELENTPTIPVVADWAKAATKPSYSLDEVPDGTSRKLANYLPLSGGTLSGLNVLKFSLGSTATYDANVAGSFLNSPIAKYMYHDILCFGANGTPAYYTTSDGTTWTEGTLNKNIFIQKDAVSMTVLSDTIVGSRWVWYSGNFHACLMSYLLIGTGWVATACRFDLLVEKSADGIEWATMHHSTNNLYNSNPFLAPLTNGLASTPYFRVTVVKTDVSASGSLCFSSLKGLTARLGNQGQGREVEFPYTWDADKNISTTGSFSASSFKKNGGTSSQFLKADGSVDSNTYLTSHQDISGKVDKEDGKALSSNDFTDDDKSAIESNTSARHTHSNKSILDAITKAPLTEHQSLAGYATEDYVDGAIESIESVAKGAATAQVFDTYSAMVTSINQAAKTILKVGYNVYIRTVGVPDLWVSSVEETSTSYTYSTDQAFVDALAQDGYVQVGYYKLSQLETQKVSLTGYATQTWVGQQGFLTSHQDISGKMDKTDASAIIVLEDNGSTTAGQWLAKSDLVTDLEDGRLYLYKIVVAGASATYLTINSLTKTKVCRYNTTLLTTQYAVGQWLLLAYNATTAYFTVVNDYDANSYAYVRQYVTANTVNTNYPLLFMYDTTKATAGSYVTKYARYADAMYANASDGSLHADKFVVTDGTSAQFLKADGSVDSNTYLTEHQDISGKVDKVDGKDLSSNDYTTDEKNKLSGIEEGAQKNVAPTWDALPDKPTIPTVPTSDINANTQARHTHSNKDILDAITKAPLTEHQSLSGYATESYVNTKVGDIETALASLETLIASL